MKTKEIIKVARRLAKPFRVSKRKDFCLKDVDPNNTLEFTKERRKRWLMASSPSPICRTNFTRRTSGLSS
jgi:NOL1/NOP2/fmu family ribosome biogenesis protein